MRILITGGCGFIGSRLGLELKRQGQDITVFDNLLPQVHGNDPEKSLLYLSIRDQVTFIEGDVREATEIADALVGIDAVYHFAAETGTGQSMYEIERYTAVNVQGTANLLQAVIDRGIGIRKIVLASSRAIYGEGCYKCEKCGLVRPNSRREEDMEQGVWSMFCPQCHEPVVPSPTPEDIPADPQSVYAITKYTQELLVEKVCMAYNIPFVILRYQNVYGAGQSMINPYTGVLAAFVNCILNGKHPEIFEDGTEARDFVHIDDVTRANVAAIFSDNCNNQIINIGSGRPITIKRAAELLIRKLGADLVPQINGKFRIGDIYNCFADVTLAIKVLNFRPEISFEAGIEEFADWARNQVQDTSLLERSFEEMASRGLCK
jgi:dTDP-L-rhamnose 4-epimerase